MDELLRVDANWNISINGNTFRATIIVSAINDESASALSRFNKWIFLQFSN